MDNTTEYFQRLIREAEAEQAQREAERKAAEAQPRPQTEPGAQIVQLNIDLLDDFPADKHPFRPASPERLEILKKSILRSGILNALLVRRKPNSQRYEILAGHNRRTAARLAGWDTVPCIVKAPETEDEAMEIMLTDNLNQREDLLPSERGRAYRQLMELRGRQGQRAEPLVDTVSTKTRDGITPELSGRNVSRYIRLTYLIPPLLDKADVNGLGLTAGEQLSFMTTPAQQAVYTYFFLDNPKEKMGKNLLAQFRKIDSNPDMLLDYQAIAQLVEAEKQNKNFRKVEIPMKSIRHHFHPGATRQEVMDTILLALDRYFSVAQEPASNSTFEGGETDVS